MRNKNFRKSAAKKKAAKPVKKQVQREEEEEEYDNSNRGVLFVNDKKETKKHPDYRGEFTDENGKEFWLAAWKKKSKGGVVYLSIFATEKEDQEEENEDDGDDLPF